MYIDDDMPFEECLDCYFWSFGSGCSRVGGCRHGLSGGVPPICARCFWFEPDSEICLYDHDCPNGIVL